MAIVHDSYACSVVKWPQHVTHDTMKTFYRKSAWLGYLIWNVDCWKSLMSLKSTSHNKPMSPRQLSSCLWDKHVKLPFWYTVISIRGLGDWLASYITWDSANLPRWWICLFVTMTRDDCRGLICWYNLTLLIRHSFIQHPRYYDTFLRDQTF